MSVATTRCMWVLMPGMSGAIFQSPSFHLLEAWAVTGSVRQARTDATHGALRFRRPGTPFCEARDTRQGDRPLVNRPIQDHIGRVWLLSLSGV
jgi:hypothetical protein